MSTADLLSQYDLGELTAIVDRWIRDGMSEDEVMLQLRDISTDAGKIFDKRFPAIRMRRELGLAPLSPSQYVQYEQDARNTLRQWGLPQGFYDSRDDFTQMLVNDISVPELAARVQNGFATVQSAPPEVRQAFETWFGTNGDAALASYFLDPTKALPVLEEGVKAAQVGGAGLQFGLTLNETRARQIAQTGATFDQARDAFGNIRKMQGLFDESMVERDVDLREDEAGVMAAFDLDNGVSQKALEDRAKSRVARSSGGGGAAVSGQGAIGLGTAQG
jgi:hypothetical protein